MVMPWRAARPERGNVSAATPGGSPRAMPVDTTARSLGRDHDVDGGMQVECGVVGVGPLGQARLGPQTFDRQVHLYPPRRRRRRRIVAPCRSVAPSRAPGRGRRSILRAA